MIKHGPSEITASSFTELLGFREHKLPDIFDISQVRTKSPLNHSLELVKIADPFPGVWPGYVCCRFSARTKQHDPTWRRCGEMQRCDWSNGRYCPATPTLLSTRRIARWPTGFQPDAHGDRHLQDLTASCSTSFSIWNFSGFDPKYLLIFNTYN